MLPAECISEACRAARAAELERGRSLELEERAVMVREARDTRLAAIARIRAQVVRPVTMTAEEERQAVPVGVCLAAYRCDRCGLRWIHASSSARLPRAAYPAPAIRTADTDKRPADHELAESIARAGLGR